MVIRSATDLYHVLRSRPVRTENSFVLRPPYWSSNGSNRSLEMTCLEQYSEQASRNSCSDFFIPTEINCTTSAATRPTRVVSNAVAKPPVTDCRLPLICSSSLVAMRTCPKLPIADYKPRTVPMKPRTGIAQMNAETMRYVVSRRASSLSPWVLSISATSPTRPRLRRLPSAA